MNQTPETPAPDSDSGLKEEPSESVEVLGQNALPADLQVVVDAMKEEPRGTQFSVCWIQRRFRIGYARAVANVTRLTSLGIIGRFDGPKFEYIEAPSVGAAMDSEKVLEGKEAVTRTTAQGQKLTYDELVTEVATLKAKLNAPELLSFRDGTVLEAAHQRDRWGSDHDAGKEPQDWFWLVGYLAGKALKSHIEGDTEKALHHTISSAAALANWHAAILGANNIMRPGISAAKQKAASSDPDGNENYLAAPIPQKCL